MVSPAPVFAAKEPTTSASVFYGPGETLDTNVGQGAPAVVMPDGPKLFLRLIPTRLTEAITTVRVRTAMNLPGGVALTALSTRGAHVFGIVNNAYGAASLTLDESGSVLSLTQVMRNREIWGIDRTMLRDDGRGNGFISLPSESFEDMFERGLENYLITAQSNLGLQPPLRIVAGITEAAGCRLEVGHRFLEPYSDPLPLPDVVYEGLVSSWEEKPRDILMPFFERLWEEFGMHRPKDWRLKQI